MNDAITRPATKPGSAHQGDDRRRRVVAWVMREIMPHEAGVRAWLRQSLVSREDADDLIQDAYCKLSALDAFDHIERADAYFFQVVRNLLMDRMRRARIVRIETIGELTASTVCNDEPSPERAAAARHELEKVRRLIAALPPRCRRIFELRKIEGLPQREIAEKLGVSLSTVENEGVRGLQLLQRALRREASRDVDRE